MSGFKSTERYIASGGFEVAVNAAVAPQRPPLVEWQWLCHHPIQFAS